MKEVTSKTLAKEPAGQSDLAAEALLGPTGTPFSKLAYHLVRGEDEALNAQLADGIEWTLMPSGQTFKGKDEVFQFLKPAFASVQDRMPEVLNNVAIGDLGRLRVLEHRDSR